MEENKKFYWLKLKKDFFKQREMKKLRAVAGGDTYTIIYLKMMLLSLVENGAILYAETEETVIEQIALEIDESFEDTKITVAFLEANKLVEFYQNDLFLLEAKECIGSESQVASRVRKHRQESNLLQCNTDVTKCNTEKELEKELEKEKKKDIYKEIYFQDNVLNSAFIEFLKIRKDLKAKNSDRAITLLVNELNKYHDDIKLKMINKSTMNSWKSVFPLNEQNKVVENKPLTVEDIWGE